jgi:hypothetical protein
VRDAGDELADGREALAVHELIAQLQLVGDVTLDADEVRDAAIAVAEGHDRARHRECRPVLAAVDQGAAPDALRAHLGADVIHHPIEAALEQTRQRHAGQLLARVAERLDAGIVAVLEHAVRSGDQDQVGGLLGRGGEQAHLRIGALQLAALHRQPQRQQPEARHHRQRRQQEADGVAGIAHRLRAEQAEADGRNQQHRHRRDQHGGPAAPRRN